ncbi:hypothetical protein BGZ80_005736 [Entomortierella chlamydospora]|uniref:C2H2-type domain-containing protein n=1 Tax=Entomortierella chlamydospora TaxID=101097 RepID=A0A9P6N0I0_9FUNG|nr:hypothetical protein BGZ80_005736 [Entomortierella chlamydospora]
MTRRNTLRNATEVVHVAATSHTDATAPTPSPAITPEPDSPLTPEYNSSDLAATKNDGPVKTPLSPLITNNVNNDLSIAPRLSQDAKDTTIDALRTAEAAAAAAQAIVNVLKDSSGEINAVAKVLTTPTEATEVDEQVNSNSKLTTETNGKHLMQTEPTPGAEHSFDVNSLYSQVMSLTSQSQKPAGKRAAQDDLEQSQAARALQLIALSLNGGTSPQSMELAESDINRHTPEMAKQRESVSVSFEEVIKGHASAGTTTTPDASESLAAISRAINFPPQSNEDTKLEAETKAFAQAILSATQGDDNRTNDSHNTNDQTHPLRDHSTTPSSSNGAAGINLSTSSTSSSSQGFTFEYDKNTGKTQIKWTTDPGQDVSSALQETNVIQQALQTLIANSGIPELSDLSVVSGGLLAPPLGQFPVQGTEFGTSSDPVVPAVSPRKKRKTGGSSKQNTAASIPEGSPSYPCTFPGCEKVFARLYNLKSHSRTHTDERPFACSHCELAFSRNHDLKRHVRIHGGGKPFKCNGCGKSFSRLDALGRHRSNSKNRTVCQAVTEVGAETGAEVRAEVEAKVETEA